MRPLIITARMAEPVAYYGDGLHFDGILSWGAYLAMPRAERDALPPMGEWALDMDLPLDRWQWAYEADCDDRLRAPNGDVWGWMCSAVHADWQVESMHAIRKKPAVGEMAEWSNSKSVVIGSGPLKAKDITVPTRFAHELVWYALGDWGGVNELLQPIHSIGKVHNIGLGVVAEWTVETVSADEAGWCESIMARRRMPLSYTTEGHLVQGGIRAPYHHRSRQIACREPDYQELRA